MIILNTFLMKKKFEKIVISPVTLKSILVWYS